MMEVEQLHLSVPTILTSLLHEFSAITDYRTLRDSLPRRLATLLKCRCVLFYQRTGETLQFASGSFDDVPGWSAALLSVAHINPIDLSSDLPEACAWRSRHATTSPADSARPTLIAVPLIHRQRAIGVLVAFRGKLGTLHIQQAENDEYNASYWTDDDIPLLEAVAGVVALLLENTRLLERDGQRISDLSLLNSIATQLNCSMYDSERVQSIVIQRAREITTADLCELIWPEAATPSSSWITPTLHNLLLARFSRQRDLTPLIIERPGDAYTTDYLSHLPTSIKTFFAIPLLVSETTPHRNGYGLARPSGPLNGYAQEVLPQRHGGDQRQQGVSLYNARDMHGPRLLGVIAGAYYRAWKLRREELVLLQVLASQASAVLENMQLMTDVVEARNEARKLLRQVLDDQRLKDRLDRLASLGEMAASVAHEVRNPLASIKTSMQILRDDLSGDEQNSQDAQESVTVVLKEVERLDSIVRDLLLFARPRQLHCVPCNLVELCDQVLHVMQAQCAQMGIIVHRVYHDVPLVYVDMGQIEQVIFNLFMNAIQAMPDGGKLTVSCQLVSSSTTTSRHIRYEKNCRGPQRSEAERVSSLRGPSEGGQFAFGKPIGMHSDQQQWLELSVSDTGVGIAPDQLERVFQPFFTTKAHGIGLGLPITRRLVENHRGYLLIESQLGYGTTVSVRLPIVNEERSIV